MDLNFNYWCNHTYLLFPRGYESGHMGRCYSNDSSFGILICLGFGLNELGGIESFMSKVDKNRIDAIDFQNGVFQILMVMMPLDFGQWLLVEFFIRLLWN